MSPYGFDELAALPQADVHASGVGVGIPDMYGEDALAKHREASKPKDFLLNMQDSEYFFLYFAVKQQFQDMKLGAIYDQLRIFMWDKVETIA